MPRPVRAIQVLPKTGPYHRNPMIIAAAVATMIAIQFMCSSSTRVCAQRLRQGHKHPDLSGVCVVGLAEALAKQTLLCPRAEIQGREGHQKRPRDEHDVSCCETGAGEVQAETGIDGMTHEAIGTGAHELVVTMDLELEVVVPAERRDRPEREGDPEHDQGESDPPEWLRHDELRPGTRTDDHVRDEEEVRDVMSEPARSCEGLAAARQPADAGQLGDHHECDDARDGDDRYERRAHGPILLD